MSFPNRIQIQRLIILASILLHQAHGAACTRAAFPKVLGGSRDDTNLYQIDYHVGSDQLAGVGMSKNPLLISDLRDDRAYVVVYIGPDKSWAWSKYTVPASTVSDDLKDFKSLAFNGDGSILACHFVSPVIAFFRAADGVLMNSQKYTTTPSTPSGSTISGRTMVLSSDSPPNVFVSYRKTSTGGYRIVSFPVTPIASSPFWGTSTADSSLGTKELGIALSESENAVYSLGYLAQGSPTTCLLSRMKVSDGTVSWTHGFSPQTTPTINANAVIRSILDTGVNYVFVAGYFTVTQYFRFTVSNGVVTASESYTDTSMSAFYVLDILPQNKDSLLALIEATGSPAQVLLVIMTLGAPLSVTYQKILPQLDTNKAVLSSLVSSTLFYVGYSEKKLYLSQTAPVLIELDKKAMWILSSESSQSCQTMTSGVSTTTLTYASSVSTDQGAAVFSTSTGTAITSNLVASTHDLLLQSEASFDSVCTNNPISNYYIISPVTQTTINFVYQLSTPVASFPISPFIASLSCGTTAPSFVYSGKLANGAALPFFMSVDAATGTISVASTTIACNYKILITGTLPNGQKTSQAFTVSCNTGPTEIFLYSPPSTVTMNLGQTTTTVLSDYCNPFGTGFATYSVTIAPGLQPYVTYSSTSRTVTYSTTSSTPPGTQSLSVSLTDGTHTRSYFWDLVVGSNSPPAFSDISTTVSVEIGNLDHFQFAGYSDPEYDDVTITSYLQGDVMLPSFVTYWTETYPVIFSIAPDASTQPGPYTIECKICDPSPGCTTATFVITVTDTPVFAGLASRYDVKLSSPGSFTYSDPAGLPLIVTITPAALTFVTCDNIGTCRLELTDASQLGTHTFTVEVCNSIPTCSTTPTITAVLSNSAPTFGTPSSTKVSVVVGTTDYYTLPAYSDADGDAITLTPIVSTSPPISLISFSPGIYMISPTQESQVGSYTVSAQACDAIQCTSFLFDIQVISALQVTQSDQNSNFLKVVGSQLQNLGPPTFLKELESIEILEGSSTQLKLPGVTDPDSDSYFLKVDLKDTFPFTEFKKTTFSFKPQASDVRQNMTYIISITLTDNNSYPLTSTYQLTVNVKGKQITFPQPALIQKVATLKILKVGQDGTMSCQISSAYTSPFSNQLLISIANNISQTNTAIWLLQGRKKLSLNFTIQQVQSRTEPKVVFNLDYPQNVSSTNVSFMHRTLQDFDKIRIEVTQNQSASVSQEQLVLIRGSSDRSYVPPQTSQNVALIQSTVASTIETFSSVFLPGCFVLSIFLQEVATLFQRQIVLNRLWTMVNDMSILILLSLVSVPVPGIASTVMQYLLQFIQFDILMTSSWLVPWINSFDDETETNLYPEGLNSYFNNNGISYVSCLKNLQSTLVYLCILVGLFIFYPLIHLVGLRSSRFQQKLSVSLKKKLFWGSSIRFLIQQCQPIILYSEINFYYVSS